MGESRETPEGPEGTRGIQETPAGPEGTAGGSGKTPRGPEGTTEYRSGPQDQGDPTIINLGLSKSPNGHFKPLLASGSRWRFHGRHVAVSEVKWLKIYNGHVQRPSSNGRQYPFGCNGYVTTVAAGQSQRFHAGVGIFNLCYLSSPPQTLRFPRSPLESGAGGLMCNGRFTYITAVWRLQKRIHHLNSEVNKMRR